MDMQKILTEAAAKVGPSGQEMQVAEYFAEQFRPLVDEVTVDNLFNVIAHKKGTGPRVALFAHMDEISLMVTAIEDDGSLRLGNVGGVDPRILPASRVWVHGKERLFGTIGAMPPHLMGAEDRSKNYDRKDLYVDVGYPAEKVRELVHVGDLVTFNVPATPLLNGQFASKTMDDRACVTMLLATAERLKGLKCDADVYFVGSTQEEIGSQGAKTAAFHIDPDLAIAIDVDHATIPGSRSEYHRGLGQPRGQRGPVYSAQAAGTAAKLREGASCEAADYRRGAPHLYRSGLGGTGSGGRAVGAVVAAAEVYAHLGGDHRLGGAARGKSSAGALSQRAGRGMGG